MCDQPVMSAAAEINGGPEKKTRPLFYGWLHVSGAEKGGNERGFYSFLPRYIYTSDFLMHDQRDAREQRDNGTPLPALMFDIKQPF